MKLRLTQFLSFASVLILLLSLPSCSGDSNSPTGSTTTDTAIYVSWNTGNDITGDGSKTNPFKTLTKAYLAAGVKLIKIEAATYSEAPHFKSGINIEGGYAVPSWLRGTSLTVFDLGSSRTTADSITSGTVISQIQMSVTAASTSGNSIALYSRKSTDSLEFRNCRFISASGAAGTSGLNGEPGIIGVNGTGGGLGSCDESHGVGGLGGTNSGWTIRGGWPGGTGGSGGLQSGPYNGVTGSPSYFSVVVSASGGGGGNGGDPGSAGGRGADGIDGSNGSSGSAASPVGYFGSNEWAPFLSGDGIHGGFGHGGGGGGGGGAQNCALCDNGGGNGGGGGASGGGSGRGGTGGMGGWGSFAVYLVESSPVFDSCYFQTGNGGNGGAGGSGGESGLGGVGGLGGTTCTGQVGAGGNGGNGGDGGAGGGGAGGTGGPSFGVYKAQGAVPTINNPLYLIGNGGAPGLGGFVGGSVEVRAPIGQIGLKGNTN